jgi:hypothetical protein
METNKNERERQKKTEMERRKTSQVLDLPCVCIRLLLSSQTRIVKGMNEEQVSV